MKPGANVSDHILRPSREDPKTNTGKEKKKIGPKKKKDQGNNKLGKGRSKKTSSGTEHDSKENGGKRLV